MKKLISLAAFVSVVGAMALPAVAANPTGTVTVNWNVTAAGSMNLFVDYGTTGCVPAGECSGGAGAAAVLSASNPAGGSGSCTAAPTTPASGATAFTFGNITPDTADSTECYYKNAADAAYATNDSAGYKVTEQITGQTNATNYQLCALGNGFAWGAAAGSAAMTASGAASAPGGAFNATTCPTGMTQVPVAVAGAAISSAGAAASTLHAGEDYALIVPPLATSGAGQYVVTYTLVLN